MEWTFNRPVELPRDYPEVALTDAFGASYLWGEWASRSVLAPGWREGGRAWVLDREPGGPFRLQAVFRRGLALASDVPVLDSPVLDDLTVVYRPSSGWVLTGWEGG